MGLILYWSCGSTGLGVYDPTTGSTVTVSGASFVSGYSGQGIEVGNGDTVAIPVDCGVALNEDSEHFEQLHGTIQFRYKATGTPHSIANFLNLAGAAVQQFNLRLNGSGSLKDFELEYNIGDYDLTITTDIFDGSWHLIRLAWASSGYQAACKLYIDGNLEGGPTTITASTANHAGATDLYIGNRADGNRETAGIIDELYISDVYDDDFSSYNLLLADDAYHILKADNVEFNTQLVITGDGAYITLHSDEVQLMSLSVNDAYHSLVVDSVVFTQVHTLTVQDAAIGLFAEDPWGLHPEEAHIDLVPDNVDLEQVHTLSVNDAAIELRPDHVTSLSSVSTLTVDDAAIRLYSETPELEITSYAITAEGEVEFPSLEIQGHCGGIAEVEFPSLVIQGTASLANNATGGVELPSLEVNALAGMIGGVSFSALEISGEGEVQKLAQGEVTFPSLEVYGEGTLTIKATGEVEFPSLEVAGTGKLAIVATGTVEFCSIKVQGEAFAGILATGGVTFPSLVVLGNGWDELTGDATVDVPSLEVLGFAHKTNRFTDYALEYSRSRVACG